MTNHTFIFEYTIRLVFIHPVFYKKGYFLSEVRQSCLFHSSSILSKRHLLDFKNNLIKEIANNITKLLTHQPKRFRPPYRHVCLVCDYWKELFLSARNVSQPFSSVSLSLGNFLPTPRKSQNLKGMQKVKRKKELLPYLHNKKTHKQSM